MFDKNKTEKIEGRGAYELAFHLVPTLGDDTVGKAFDNIIKLVEKVGGKVVSKSEPAVLNLEYTMEKTVDSVRSKYNTAYFAWIIFTGGEVDNLSTTLESNDDVLRHLLIKTEQSDSIKTEEVANIINNVEEEGEKKEKTKIEESEEGKEEVIEEKIKADESVDENSEMTKEEKDDEQKVDEAIDELVK